MPTTMQAVVVEKLGVTAVKSVAVPSIGPKDILVKTEAVALNPTDWKHRDWLSESQSILGCDFAGTVDSIGGEVTNVKKGDRVAGFVHGGRHPDTGAFAEYVRTLGTLVWKVPENVSWEEAAALGGIGPHTAVQCLFMRLRLKKPDEGTTKAEPILVWSGATSVGLYAIQLLKLSGYTVITTSSPKHFEYLKSLGADDTYPYADADTPSKISSKYPTLAKCLDTISEGDSTIKAAKCLGADAKDKVVWRLLGPDPEPIKDVHVEDSIVYTVIGKAFAIGPRQYHVMLEDKKEIEAWLEYVPTLIASGKFKSNPIWSQSGGLAGVSEGLELLKAGKNSGQKITFKL